jgi:hypothetical protein
VSCISGEDYRPLMRALWSHQNWISSYSNRPGRLFEGVEQRLVILLTRMNSQPRFLVTAYQHWYAEERECLFDRLHYYTASTWSYSDMPIKSGSSVAENIFRKLEQHRGRLPTSEHGTSHVWLNDAPTYWVRALSFPPGTRNSHWKAIPVADCGTARIVAGILSSTTFYFFYKMVSNCRDLGEREWSQFPIDPLSEDKKEQLERCGRELEACLRESASPRLRRYDCGASSYQEFYPARAKIIIDKIDTILGQHYGLDPEELDYLLHYDAKYRLGTPCSQHGGDKA